MMPEDEKAVKQEKRVRYSMVMLFVIMLAFTGLNAWFTREQAQQASHTACPVWILIDTVYASQPPTSPNAQTFAKVVHQLASHCPKD